MKKLTIYCLSAIALLASVSAYGQNRIQVKQQKYALVGDIVYVELAVNMNNAKVDRNSSVILTPYLKSGNRTMDMPSMMINGSTQHAAYNRLVALNKAPSYIQSEVNAGNRKSNQTHIYKITIPYEMWMKDAEFFVRQDQCACNGQLKMISFDPMSKMEDRNPPLQPPYKDVEMNFAVSYIVPNPEPVKERSESGKAFLDFPVGKSVLNPDFGNNFNELSKIGQIIREVKSNPYAKITKMTVSGCASPEGSSSANQTLSTNRAAALKNNLKNTYGFSESEMKVSGRGEDWTGFEKLIEESTLPQKDEVLAIIRNGKSADVKERELRALAGGSVFKTLTDEYFPKLRRTDYELSYVIVPLTIEQSKELLKIAPRNLSLNEMFLVAQTYPAGSEEYNEVFEIAARVFPDSNVSVLNAAANALARNDLKSAEKFLNKVTVKDAAYYNNLGVMHSLKGEYGDAMQHFLTAKEKGSAEAERNIAELEKMKEAEKELTK